MSISLTKNQSVSLAKQTSSSLSLITLAVGWDVARPKGFFGKVFGGGNDSIDLDASALLLDAAKHEVDTIWFGQLQSRDGVDCHREVTRDFHRELTRVGMCPPVRGVGQAGDLAFRDLGAAALLALKRKLSFPVSRMWQ